MGVKMEALNSNRKYRTFTINFIFEVPPTFPSILARELQCHWKHDRHLEN